MGAQIQFPQISEGTYNFNLTYSEAEIWNLGNSELNVFIQLLFKIWSWFSLKTRLKLVFCDQKVCFLGT